MTVTALHWAVLAGLHASAARAPVDVARVADAAPRGPGAVRVVAAPLPAQAAPPLPPPIADAAPRRARRTLAPPPSEPAVDDAAVRRPAWPTYMTQAPAAFSRRYRVQRGTSFAGYGVFDWQPDDDGYTARFSAELGPQSFAWESRGAFDAAGLAPQRYVDRRARRGAQAANFLRDAARIAYSGPSVEHPLPPGAQDRLSWLVQLAAIVQARGAALPAAGETLTLYVSGARGDADRWDFVVDGVEPVATPAGVRDALRLTREPRRRWDVRVEVWLDAAVQHLPVRVLTTPTGAAPPMEWLLDDAR